MKVPITVITIMVLINLAPPVVGKYPDAEELDEILDPAGGYTHGFSIWSGRRERLKNKFRKYKAYGDALERSFEQDTIATQALVKINNQVKREKEELLLKTKTQATMIQELQRRNKELNKMIHDIDISEPLARRNVAKQAVKRNEQITQPQQARTGPTAQPQTANIAKPDDKVVWTTRKTSPLVLVYMYLFQKDKQNRTWYRGIAQLYTSRVGTAVMINSIAPMDSNSPNTDFSRTSNTIYSVQTPLKKNGDLPNLQGSLDLKSKLQEINVLGKKCNKPAKWNGITLKPTDGGKTKTVSLCVIEGDKDKLIAMCHERKTVVSAW